MGHGPSIIGRRAAGWLGLAAIVVIQGCHRDTGADNRLPAVSSPQYLETVSAFNVGLAALQVGDDLTADARLGQTTQLAPDEPAGWANWAVLAMRQQHFDAARERLQRALAIEPGSDHLHFLLGLLEAAAGRPAEAIASLRRAAELNPADLRTTYALALQVERQGDEGSDAEVARLIESMLAKQPGNLAAQLELARISAKRGDAATLASSLGKVAAQSGTWPAEAREQLAALQSIVATGDLRAAGARTTILRNVLLRVPQYRKDRDALKATPGEEARPFTAFVRLAPPVVRPSPADSAMRFDVKPLAGLDGSGRRWSWAGAIQLGDAGAPVAAAADGRQLRLANGATMAFPGGAAGAAPSPEGVLQVDFNYDFRTDLVLAGEGGVRLYRQDSAERFSDVTGKTGLPRSIVDGRYTGAWAVDIEADGDLDIVLGSRQGAPLVLRNNGDGTFAAIHPFSGVSGLWQLAWADLDGDGNPDAALIDGSGQAHLFINERQGQFRERALPAGLGTVAAIAVADARNDGSLELIAVKADGSIVRIADRNDGQDWDLVPIASVPQAAEVLSHEVRLRAADLDNNGAIDLVLSPIVPAPPARAGAGPLIWLGSPQGGLQLLAGAAAAGPAATFDAADLRGSGRLDLIGLSDSGQAVSGVSQGTSNYHWQVVRPRAAQAFGDQRINPFGVGGEVEIRSGLLVQKQPIAGPQVHFGLGEHEGADVARVYWPNGASRAEFALKPDQAVLAEQRLKGSCPFYFAFDGKGMQFIKDGAPWGSAIGLRINTIGTAAISATEEWYRIGRDQLVPHGGYYDLRVTAELWEVYYYDYLALMAVDHPAGTDVYVDESFVIPAPRLAVTAVDHPHDIVQAVDDDGNDVTAILRTLDGRGLANFGRGQYQGVTRDHFVEVDLGPDVPSEGPVYLLASGSIYPTDSSINVAMTQGGRWRAHGLSLEVPDGHGGWLVARDNLGFPAGRKKTMLIDLTRVFRPGTPHRIRLRTNLELFWDQIQWARGLPATELRTTRLAPTLADLHYRGYSQINRPDAASPELPDYQVLTGSRQRWRDLAGYYTRFGDVRELLAGIDDRYVIMNSGDEMSLRFPEQPPPPAGWVRDFVVIGDGWIKDGDYNSTFGKTVQPLPYHAKRLYVDPPGRLEDEPAFRQHPEDWQTYHTRYVTPDEFRNALRQ